VSHQLATATLTPETAVVPLPVCVYHVTLFDGDDSSASAAVVGVDGMKTRGAVGSSSQHDVLVPSECTLALGTDVVIDVITLTTRLSALLRKYQLHTPCAKNIVKEKVDVLLMKT